ncbi:unnamed protein product [Spirodela intermedia]|uniref:Dof zinc finger protein n=1 Tax=Spirodela intermedia TaxID=51605 RepID=A0A7I8IC66_SPIIN|nr:unnamed protein product [Spirodela intermedia]CAA6654954.1 unnamed protein product [Spirodela intermedia]
MTVLIVLVHSNRSVIRQLAAPAMGAAATGFHRAAARPEGSVRAGSMTDRARQAKLPLPEPGLKCPRCESTNTKFCYFNNYSLSQPRHFCKTCRRYWTRGGALRNVPVGGGCRRNKRSKGAGGSKSSTSSTDRHSNASTPSTIPATSGTSAIPSNLTPQPTLPFFTSLHTMPAYTGLANMGSSFGGIQPVDAVNFQTGVSSSAAILDQWRLQQGHQFPFMGGLETPPPPLSMGLFPFDGQGVVGDGAGYYAGQTQDNSSAAVPNAHPAPVKGDEEAGELTLRRHYLGIPKNDQFWGDGGATGSSSVWADISGFSSASTGNIL